MSRMVEFLNPQSYTIQLSSPDKTIVKVPGKSKIVLSDWFMIYCPKYLRVVRMIDEEAKLTPKEVKTKHKPQDKRERKFKPNIPKNHRKRSKPPKPPKPNKRSRRTREKKKIMRTQNPRAPKHTPKEKDPIVGRRAKENTNKLYNTACQNNKYSISNNIGVGILSFNRLKSLKRLIGSIRANTDLSHTTIFVSDESTNSEVPAWLQKQTDIVVLTNQKRLGIAGNTNRLLRCLSRFKYGIILNDDVEILRSGWEHFYRKAHETTNIHHFCYQQAGVYGAKRNNKFKLIGNTKIKTIKDKPHGAVMFFTHKIFQKIGYFDESFGMYGMEHVDWSTRASRCKIQPDGFHDVIGSERYFKTHQENSAVPQRTSELSKSRKIYQKVKDSNSRIYVDATKASQVPSISVVIPIRDIGRKKATKTVVDSIRAQLFPNIEILISEQDENPIVRDYGLGPRQYSFAKNKYRKQPFTKAMAFNLGVANASFQKIVLHDADIICPANYISKVHKLLDSYSGLHIGSRVLYLDRKATEEVSRTCKINSNANCTRVVTYYEGGSLACTKKAYFRCGAFNEIFEGYGIEDCDFFSRLKYNSNFYNERTEDFVHMWHGRTDGWAQHHRRNKKIFAKLRKQYNASSYINSLTKKIKASYPRIAKECKL